MSTPTSPSSTPSSTPSTTPHSSPLRPLHLTLLLTCPLLALLPPRKLDLYTFSLTGAWIVSAEELVFGSARVQRRHRNSDMRPSTEGQRDEREDKGEQAEGEGVKGLAKKLWMGDERAGWQKRRMEKEREELETGKGYGDIIMEQVREVFPGFGGRRREEEEAEGD